MTTNCATCHNARLKTADLALDTIDVSDPASNPAVWEKVLQKVRTGVMPPPQVRHPAPAAIASFLGSIEGSLDRAATAHPNPGRVPLIHRLNRTEYRNAIRDLLAVDDLPKEMDISLLLPPDEIGEGFDNMAAALFVSPSLIERYVGAARKISRLAVGDLAVPRMIDTYQLSGQLPQDVHLEELPLGTRGGVLIRRTFPVDGEYTFDVQVARGGVYDPSTAGEGFELELTIDGARAQLFKEERRQPAAGDQRQGRRGAGGGGPLQARIAVTAGPARHRRRLSPESGRADRGAGHAVRPRPRRRVGGAVERHDQRSRKDYGRRQHAEPPAHFRVSSRRVRIGFTPHGRRDSDAACANRILSGLARRAFRRPVNNDDVAPLLQFYDRGQREGGFDDRIKRALERLLVSPEFLFRIEFDPGDVRA